MNMFTIDDKQAKLIEEFMSTHKCKLRTSEHGGDDEIYVGAIGGATTYSFTPTSMGMIVEVSCACGAKKNVTDFDEW